MADLNHTSKKDLVAELKVAREELRQSESLRSQHAQMSELHRSERDQWKQAAEEMKTNRDDLSAQIENHIAHKVKLREELKYNEQRLNDVRTLFHRADRDAGKFAQERDQARAALQALALSNGRLTEHMDAKEAVMSSTNSCTPR